METPLSETARRAIQIRPFSIIGLLMRQGAQRTTADGLGAELELEYHNGRAEVFFDGNLAGWADGDDGVLGIAGLGDGRVKNHFRSGPGGLEYCVSIGGHSYTVRFIRYLRFSGLRESDIEKDGEAIAELRYTPRILFLGGDAEVVLGERCTVNEAAGFIAYHWMEINSLMQDTGTVS